MEKVFFDKFGNCIILWVYIKNKKSLNMHFWSLEQIQYPLISFFIQFLNVLFENFFCFSLIFYGPLGRFHIPFLKRQENVYNIFQTNFS